MTEVIITGAAGRMGRVLVARLDRERGLKLAGATEQAGHPACGRDAAEVAGLPACGIPIQPDLKKVMKKGRVIIDFTAPAATRTHLAGAVRAGLNVVIGTTGLEPADFKSIRAASRKIAVVQSGNMSVGINLLVNLVARAAAVLGEQYDVEIVETHHRFKKDAPSGTATMLAEAAARGLGRDLARVAAHGRQGITGERPSAQIGIHAVRAGDVVGEHTVIFGALGERVELAHKAHTREIFALGALRAAKFLAGKKNGLYDMQDVLGLK